MSRRPAELAHLARRFAAALRPQPPSFAEETWAASWLSPTEEALWRSQAPVDQAHTIAVARRVAEACGGDPPRWLMAAALLHDVGKAQARLGVAGRTLATMLELFGVRQAPGSLGVYLTYTDRGAAVLRDAGADPRVVAWAREHHLPPASWSGVVARAHAELLAEADRS